MFEFKKITWPGTREEMEEWSHRSDGDAQWWALRLHVEALEAEVRRLEAEPDDEDVLYDRETCPVCGAGDWEDMTECWLCRRPMCDKCGSLPEAVCDGCGAAMTQERLRIELGEPEGGER